jgi:serine/threonine protein kinase
MSDIPQRLATALGDRYVLEREIGAGGMATVYLARDLRHKRSVALKVVRPELGGPGAGDRHSQELAPPAIDDVYGVSPMAISAVPENSSAACRTRRQILRAEMRFQFRTEFGILRRNEAEAALYPRT